MSGELSGPYLVSWEPCELRADAEYDLEKADVQQEHRHSFVRKNAVFAVYSIYQDHESMIPDAPELLDTFLAAVRSCTLSGGLYIQMEPKNGSRPTVQTKLRYRHGEKDGLTPNRNPTRRASATRL